MEHHEEGPAGLVADHRREEGSDERADVDPHVEDVEPSIPFGVASLVEVADHDRDIGLEEAVTDDQADR